MAAKIGAALLEENSALKEEYARLINQINSSAALTEEHEKQEEKYLSTIEGLQQNIADLESQLSNEKQQNFEIKLIFEGHKGKLRQTLPKLENKLKKGERIVNPKK